MIQLANDPNTRTAGRPGAQGDKLSQGAKRRPPAHAWPFLSPHANRVERPVAHRSPSNDSGS